MMTRDDVTEALLLDFLNDDLDQSTREALVALVEVDEGLAEEIDKLKATHALLNASVFERRARARQTGAAIEAAYGQPTRTPGFAWAAAAAVLLVGALVMFLVWPEQKSPQPQVQPPQPPAQPAFVLQIPKACQVIDGQKFDRLTCSGELTDERKKLAVEAQHDFINRATKAFSSADGRSDPLVRMLVITADVTFLALKKKGRLACAQLDPSAMQLFDEHLHDNPPDPNDEVLKEAMASHKDIVEGFNDTCGG